MSSSTTTSDAPLVVLILGGTTTVARPLVDYLITGDTPKASFVRLADKFSVSPPSTYLDKTFINHLTGSSTFLEYKQVNLQNVANHETIFTPPATWNDAPLKTRGPAFDVVFDLTGETSAEKPEIIQIQHTYNLARSLAQSATSMALRPGAWVRLTFPYYEMKSSSPHVEGSDLKADGHRGRWWHETLRGIGEISQQDEGFKFGIIRCGAPYGPGVSDGEVVARLVVGHVYSHLKEEMKFLHNSDLRIHTAHTSDIAQSLHLVALYLLSNDASTIAESSTPLSFPFSAPSSILSKRTSISESWKTVKTVVPEKVVVKVPIFNVVDDGDSTQEKLAKAVAEVWGIKWGFLNSTVASLVQQFAKTDFSEMVEDVNEKHVEAWSAMLAASDPSITSSPITPFLDEHAFKKHAISLDSSKARKILGFEPLKPKVEVEELKRIVQGFQDDGIWPK